MGESALQFNDDQLDELTRTLLEDADATNSGSITFEELQSALSRHPGLVENLTFRLVVKLPFNIIIIIRKSQFLPQCRELVSTRRKVTQEEEIQAHPTLDEAVLFQKQPHLDHLAFPLFRSQRYPLSRGVNPISE